MKKLLAALLLLATPALAGPPILWGSPAKILGTGINFSDQGYILTGTVDPTVSATLAPRGSLYMRTGASGGAFYSKQDNGSTTNWSLLTTGITTPISIGNGGTGQSSKTAAFDALSPNTTKGDVTVHNGTNNVRRAVGADGQVLIADSADTMGLRYSTPTPVNYIIRGDAESGTTGFSAYKDAAGALPVDGTAGTPTHISIATSGTAPLRGSNSFIITNSGSTSAQGEGISTPFTISTADESKVLTVGFSYIVNSGTFVAGSDSATGDLNVYLYDVTNSQVIQPAGFKLTCNSSTLACGYQGSFQTASNSTSYRLIWHVAGTNTSAWSLKVDDVAVSPVSRVFGPSVSEWVAYSPSVTATTTNPTKGTINVDSGKWRRVGDSIEIQYNYYQTTAGSAGSGTYLFGLPSGISGDTTKVAVSTDGFTSGVGVAHVSDRTTNDLTGGSVSLYDSTHLALYLSSGGFFSSSHPNFTYGTANLRFTILARVPVSGWGSSTQISQDGDSRVVAAGLKGDPASATAGNPIIFPTVGYDTHGAYNTTTGRYTAPSPGLYRVFGYLSTAAINTIIRVYVNGVQGSDIGVTMANDSGTFNGTVKVNAGDLIDIRPSGTCDADATSVLFIERLSGPEQIAASEKIVAVYTSTSGQTLASGAVVNFETKVNDTHGTVTTGVGTWKFTAPRADYYEACGNVQWGASTPSNFSITIAKNGVGTAINGSLVSAQFGVSVWCGIVQMLAGDYLQALTNNSAGSAINTGNVQFNVHTL